MVGTVEDVTVNVSESEFPPWVALTDIFCINFKPKFLTSSCTLGYFRTTDFLVDPEVEETFNGPKCQNFDESFGDRQAEKWYVELKKSTYRCVAKT